MGQCKNLGDVAKLYATYWPHRPLASVLADLKLLEGAPIEFLEGAVQSYRSKDDKGRDPNPAVLRKMMLAAREAHRLQMSDSVSGTMHLLANWCRDHNDPEAAGHFSRLSDIGVRSYVLDDGTRALVKAWLEHTRGNGERPNSLPSKDGFHEDTILDAIRNCGPQMAHMSLPAGEARYED